MILLFCKIIYWVSIKFTSCDKLFGTFLSVWNASSLLKFRKKAWNSFIFMWNNKITLFFWSLFVVNMTSTLWLVVLYMFSHFFAQIFPGHALLFILKGHEFEPGHGIAANWIVFGAEFRWRWRRRRHPGGELWRSSMGRYQICTKIEFLTQVDKTNS